MANRILTWHKSSWSGKEERMDGAYYMEAEYSPIAVRINAEVAPSLADAEFDIFDDGASIFNDRGSEIIHLTTGARTFVGSSTSILLIKGETEEVAAEDFNNNIIEEGSWITCNLIQGGKGKNFTVHLELEKVSEDEEVED